MWCNDRLVLFTSMDNHSYNGGKHEKIINLWNWNSTLRLTHITSLTSLTSLPSHFLLISQWELWQPLTKFNAALSIKNLLPNIKYLLNTSKPTLSNILLIIEVMEGWRHSTGVLLLFTKLTRGRLQMECWYVCWNVELCVNLRSRPGQTKS